MAELRNSASMQQFGVRYDQYSDSVERPADDVIRQMYPMNVSIAEPDPGN